MIFATGFAFSDQTTEPTANERLVDIIGQPISTEYWRFREKLVWLFDQSDRAREHGASERKWRGMRERAVLAVLRHPDSRRFAVENTFQALLHRSPTRREMSKYRRVLRYADTRLIIKRIAGADEYYFTRGGDTDEGFLAALFKNLLDREADPDSTAYLGAKLAAGVSRSKIVAHLLASAEYRKRLVTEVYHTRGLGAPDAAQLAEGNALLHRIDGYRRLLARVLASDAYAQVALSPTPPDAELNPSGGALPLPPQIGLGTAWSLVPTVPPGDLNTIDLVAASDGSLWRTGHDNNSIYVYDPQMARWSQNALPPQTGVQTIVLAPTSATQAWVAYGGDPEHGFYEVDGDTLTSYAGPSECPSGNCLEVLSATALSGHDGVLWAVSETGNLFTFNPAAPSGQQWTSIPAGPYQISTVSGVGAASGAIDAYALDGTEALQHTNAGWAPVTEFSGVEVLWIQGCADGSVWALVNTPGIAPLWQLRAGGKWDSATDVQAPSEDDLSRWGLVAAASKNRLYMTLIPKDPLSDLNYQYWALSIGVVDQPHTPFPQTTPGQQAAYNAISLGLGVTIQGGVRKQYTNAAVDFSDWYTKITTNQIPIPVNPDPPFTQADWDDMLVQIATELQYVTDVYKLFNDGITPLISEIQSASSPLLGPAAEIVGLETTDDNLSIGLFFAQMFANTFTDFVASFGVPGAVAAGVVGSILTAGVNDLFPSVPPQNPVVQAYSEVATNLSQTFLKSNDLAANYLTTIVQDWGMLSTVGGLINNGKWEWEYDDAQKLAEKTVNGFNVSFYQALFPAKWQIVNTTYGDYVKNPWVWTPDYDTYQVPCPSCNQYAFPVEYVWFANLLGGSSDVNDDLGPLPQQLLFETLGDLSVNMDNFWRSKGGWTTKQVPATF